MAFFKYALLASSLIAPVFSQDDSLVPLPQITQGPDSSGGCNGCYVVADVAAIVFGSEFITQMDTVSIGIQTGKNGSYTSTQVIVGNGKLSISTQGGFGGALNPYTLNNSSIINVGGASLTSPTAYQVFTSYSVTRSFEDGQGNCITSSGSPQAPTIAFSKPIPETLDENYVASIEAEFIAAIGLTCSPGGISESTTTVASGTVLTTTTSSVGPLTFRPQPVSTQGPFTPIGTGSSNFTGGSVSPYIPGGTGATLSITFASSTLPLMAIGALSVLLAACAL